MCDCPTQDMADYAQSQAALRRPPIGSNGVLPERVPDDGSHGVRWVNPFAGDPRHELIRVERPITRLENGPVRLQHLLKRLPIEDIECATLDAALIRPNQIVDAGEHIGEPGLRAASLSFAVWISVYAALDLVAIPILGKG